jgi:hypothetical protein
MADAEPEMLIADMAARARTASRRLAAMTDAEKSRALLAAAAAIRSTGCGSMPGASKRWRGVSRRLPGSTIRSAR